MRDYAGFLTNSITGFRNHTTGTDHVHGLTGCTYESALNFNPNASEENGSCEWQSVFTTIPNAPNSTCAWTPELGYHMWVNGTSVSDSYTGKGSVISPCPYGLNYGCTDPEAQNYNPSAEQDWTHGDDYDTLCNYITDAKGKKGERFRFRRFGGNDYGFSRSGFQSNGFTKGAPTSQPIAASFANACGCGV